MSYLRTITRGRINRTPSGHKSPDPLTRTEPFYTGTVKWFNEQKGFGFIVPIDGSEDVFVHLSAVQRSGLHTLQQGQVVEYSLLVRNNGKLRAGRLRLK